MNESSTSRQCKNPGCKKPAEPNSEYCLACQQDKNTTFKHRGIKVVAFLGTVLIAGLSAIFRRGKGSQKG